MPNTYKEATYKVVLCWTADTKIKYATNPKRGKSFKRYAKYAKAKTVAQAMLLGSFPQDLFFDFEHGYIKVVGGPLRTKPLDPSKQADDWTDVDIMLAKMHRAWKTWTNTFAVAKKLGVDRRQLTANKTTAETTEVRASRLAANELAKMVLKDVAATRRKISDRDVVAVLRMWGFKENSNRGNVIPEGKTFVFSDTLGLVSNYRGCVSVAQATTEYLAFTQVLTGWLGNHMPASVAKSFCYTSINVNANYAGALHRDANNEGPSLIKAFGKFTGGELNYWMNDDKTKGPVQKMCQPGEGITIDLKKNLLLFDGNRGHCVNDFDGERFSLVFFSIGQYRKADKLVRDELGRSGIRCPVNSAAVGKVKKMLGAPGEAASSKSKWCWPVEGKATGSNFLGEGYAKQAKESAYRSENSTDDCTDKTFVDHKTTYVTLPDGRRGVRVYLLGKSGGQKLVVSGDEVKKNSSLYRYEKVKTFRQGPPLSTERLGDVRAWLETVLGQPLKARAKRCVSSFGGPETKKRRLSAAGA